MHCGIGVRDLADHVLLLGIAISTIAAAGAQTLSTASLEGQLSDVGNRDVTVELVSVHDSVPDARTAPSLDGQFEFSGIPAGTYEVRVLDGAGHELARQIVNVSGPGSYVNMRLPEQQNARRPASNTVSVAALRRKISPKAKKEFKKAHDASQSGDEQKAMEHLKKAIQIDPGYMEAYNNLGARYLKVKQYDAAVEQLRKAVELDGHASTVLANLSYAYYALERYPEAEQAARSAVAADAGNRRARLMLGLALASSKTSDDEAVRQLEAVEDTFPKARLVIAQVLARKGQRERASAELTTYLRAGNVDNREQVERWLAQLK